MASGPRQTHRRFNPLLAEWVLCSEERLGRPWQGLEEPAPATVPSFDPGCYLCPGNVRADGTQNPAYTTTYVFDNDFPALTSTTGGIEGPSHPLLHCEPARGRCRVLCCSPRHDLCFARLPERARDAVIDAWCQETETLSQVEHVRHVQLFENRGALMGCSNPHPHCQVWATDHVPTLPARKASALADYQRAHGRDLLGHYIEVERHERERIVLENSDWVVVVPFWAVWPFETLLLPRRHVRDLQALNGAERSSLASAIAGLQTRYDNLFRTPFPYSMAWHGQPCDGTPHPGWRLHASFLPPLLRSASIRKFLVGYELSAEPQRDLTPEAAAAALRAQSDIHYLES